MGRPRIYRDSADKQADYRRRVASRRNVAKMLGVRVLELQARAEYVSIDMVRCPSSSPEEAAYWLLEQLIK